jgi:hypothetical protein
MLSNRLAFVALAVACITAAAAGGYLASRQNTVPTPASAAASVPAQVPASAPAAAAPAEKPVQETEAVVGDPPKATSAAPTAEAQDTTRTADASRRVDAGPRASSRSTANAKPTMTGSTRREPAATADRTAPASPAATAPQPSPVPVAPPVDQTLPLPVRPDDHIVEQPREPAPPVKTFEELVVPADAVMGLQLTRTITSESARVEDRVDARVTRDVRAGDRVAIPAGTRAIGTVTQVEKGGKFKDRARLAIRFHTLVLADGTSLPVSTETIYREGEAPSAAQKIGGGAVGGAIIGAILGGAKGAAAGAAAGAAGGTAVTAAGDRSAATMPAGTQTTIRILSPVTVTIEK